MGSRRDGAGPAGRRDGRFVVMPSGSVRWGRRWQALPCLFLD